MPRTEPLRRALAAAALAAGVLALVPAASGETRIPARTPAAQAVPVVEARCQPRLTCWRDHWGARRCFRRWICADDTEPRYPSRRRSSLEDDFPPESRFGRDREPSLRRYRGSTPPWRRWRREPGAGPEVVRPERPGSRAPDGRNRVTLRPRLKEVPDAQTDKTAPDGPAEPEAPLETDRPSTTERPVAPKPEAASRHARPAEPRPEGRAERTPGVEVIPRPAPADTEKESARLKEPPPVPARPRTDGPARINPAPLTPKKPAVKVPDRRQVEPAPDDIDKLPRGRKIPMDEIEPPQPKKKLPPRMRI